LDAALLKAQAEVGGVAKDGRNSHQKYDYVSAEQQLAHAGPVLRRNGLVFCQSGITIKNISVTDTLVMEAEYQLSHPESGASRTFTKQIPIAGRGDLMKASLAAQTTLLNYAMRDLLLIPRGEQYEVDNLEAAPSQSAAGGKPKPAVLPHPLPTMIKTFDTYAALDNGEWKERVLNYYGVKQLSDLNEEQAVQVWNRLESQGKLREKPNV